MSPDPVNTTTGLQLSEYAPIAFGSLEPGSQATSALATAPSVAAKFKPLSQTHEDHQGRIDRHNSFTIA